ncbi:MAG: hypothetical protein ACLSF3_00805 [Anaerobutyricum hallii]|uniref:hypothetical protein n=1 Tax=Anaerobutyricum hallii TaxID=39488 RepID=UPI003992B573
MMENRTLSLEDIKLLVEKVHAAQQAGNYILFRYANYSIDVLTMQGEISEEKNWGKEFEMPLGYDSDATRREYNECILYLEKLAGEEHDN